MRPSTPGIRAHLCQQGRHPVGCQRRQPLAGGHVDHLGTRAPWQQVMAGGRIVLGATVDFVWSGSSLSTLNARMHKTRSTSGPAAPSGATAPHLVGSAVQHEHRGADPGHQQVVGEDVQPARPEAHVWLQHAHAAHQRRVQHHARHGRLLHRQPALHVLVRGCARAGPGQPRCVSAL